MKKQILNTCKKLAVFTLSFSLVFSFSACREKEDGNDSSESSVITLNVWHQWAGEKDILKKQYDEIVSDYEAVHPEIVIKTSKLDTDTYKTKIASEFAGNAEDVDVFFYWGSGAAAKYVQAGKLLPLGDYLADGVTGKLKTGSMKAFTYDGTIYSLPMYSWYLTLFCNKTLFAKAGAKIPGTWDELFDAVQKLKAIGVEPIASGARDGWNAALIYQALALRETGAENIQRMLEGQKDFGDNPGYSEAAEMVVKLFKEGAFGTSPLDESNDDANDKFQVGTAAMRLTGSWFLNTLYNARDDSSQVSMDEITAVSIPVIEGKGNETDYCGGFVDGFFINKNTKYKQEAADFVTYLSEKFGNIAYEGEGGFSAWDQSETSEDPDPLFKEVRILAEKGKNGVLAWDTELPPVAAQAHNEGVQYLFTSGADVATFLRDQEEAMN